MLKEALRYIAKDLDQFLMRNYHSQENRVILGNILEQDGSTPEENRNKILLTLISLEHETHMTSTRFGKASGNGYAKSNPPLMFNLDIMFSAFFNQYDESLKFLSDTIYFFQAKPLFTHDNSPGLDPKIDQMSLEVIRMTSAETHNLWTSLGAKYVPSIPFKLRLLSFQSDQVIQIVSSMQAHGSISKPVSA